MIFLKGTYGILRIAIGVIILFFLVQCTQKSTSVTDEELLKLIKKYKETDLPKALELSDTLIVSAQQRKDTVLMLEGYLQKGVVMTHIGDREKAINTFKSQLPLISDKRYPEMRCRYFLGIGNTYVLHGEDLEALIFYEKALEVATAQSYANWKCIAQVNIAKIKRNIGDKKEALKIYKDAYTQVNNFNISKGNQLRILMGIGGTYLTLNKPDSALYYSKLGLKMAENMNDKMLESYFHHDIGIAYTKKQEYQNALKNLYKVTAYTESIKNDERSAEALFYIGKCYYGLQKYELASRQFEKVIVIVDSSDELKDSKFKPQELLKTYDLLIACYSKLKKDDAFIKLVKSNQKNLSVKIKNDNNEVKATLYKSQNKVLADIIKQKEKEGKFKERLVYVILGLLILAFIAVFYYKNKSKSDKRKFQALMESQNQKKFEEKDMIKQIRIKDTKVDAVLKRLEKLERQEYYLEVTCSLSNMAKKAKTNGTYLTKILKEHKGKTFYEYINELRISYAIQRLQTDKQFRKYAIRHIAKEVGYKSPESFAKHFKKATGINPSYYIKEIEKL